MKGDLHAVNPGCEEERQPWEKRVGSKPRESDVAYAAFVAYRDMGAEVRSVRGVAQKLAKSRSLISRWSQTHDWADRVQAWEQHLRRETDAATVEDVLAWRRKVVRAMLDQAEGDLDYLAAMKKLRLDLASFSVVGQDAGDGAATSEPAIDYKRLHAVCALSKAIDVAEGHLLAKWLTPVMQIGDDGPEEEQHGGGILIIDAAARTDDERGEDNADAFSAV